MKTRYRNVSFLVELIINILVFSISCALLVRLFAVAGETSRLAAEQSRASTELTGLVEGFKAHGQNDAFAEPLTFFYDGAWNPTESQTPGGYTLELTVTDEGSPAGLLRRIEAAAYGAAAEPITQLSTAVYYPAEVTLS